MIKYNTRFGIRAQNGSEKGAIRVRVSYQSKRVELSLGGSIAVADFDGKREQAKKGVPQAREINRLINESRKKILFAVAKKVSSSS